MKRLFPAENADENVWAINEIFRIANLPIPLESVLNQCLDVLLSLSWLSLLPKAGLFLVENRPGEAEKLRLVVNRNMGEEISRACGSVEFGHCLCGQAAQTKQPIHSSCIDSRHETVFEGMQPHGHYNIPIIAGEHVLGVLVFYLPHGSSECKEQQDYLMRCASVLSLVIELRFIDSAIIY